MKRLLLITLAALILVGVLAVVYWRMTPTLVEVTPQDTAEGISAGSSLKLHFSRPMQAGSVEERLQFDPTRSGTYVWEDQTLTFTPHQPWPNGSFIQVRLDEGARAEGFLPLTMRGEHSWSFTIGQPRLAYLYPADGPANVYLWNPASEESIPITEVMSGVLDYDIDAKGAILYYSVKNGQRGSSIYQLDINDQSRNPDSTLVVECQRAICRAPQISPQGDFLAYERTAFTGSEDPPYPQVWAVPLRGVDSPDEVREPIAEAQAFLAGNPLHQTLQPHWSASGLLTFYDTNQSAFVVMDPRSGESFLLPNQTGQPGSWDQGEDNYVVPEIFFVELSDSESVSDLDRVGSSHLILYNLEDESTQDLTQMDYLEDTSPVFSPDGSTLAFARKYLTIEQWTPGRQLWLMQMDDGSSQQLTNDPFYNHFDFAWSPKGNQLAFVRFNQTELTESPQIWIIDPQTTLTKRLIEGGYAPKWIP